MRARLIAAFVIGALLVPGVVAAQEVAADRASDSPVVADLAADNGSDRVTDIRPVTDRAGDRVTDRPSDRCRPADFDRRVCCPDRPVDDRPDRCRDSERPLDVNLRQLIWRLIEAHEWEKLFQLLHRLHIL